MYLLYCFYIGEKMMVYNTILPWEICQTMELFKIETALSCIADAHWFIIHKPEAKVSSPYWPHLRGSIFCVVVNSRTWQLDRRYVLRLKFVCHERRNQINYPLPICEPVDVALWLHVDASIKNTLCLSHSLYPFLSFQFFEQHKSWSEVKCIRVMVDYRGHKLNLL